VSGGRREGGASGPVGRCRAARNGARRASRAPLSPPRPRLTPATPPRLGRGRCAGGRWNWPCLLSAGDVESLSRRWNQARSRRAIRDLARPSPSLGSAPPPRGAPPDPARGAPPSAPDPFAAAPVSTGARYPPAAEQGRAAGPGPGPGRPPRSDDLSGEALAGASRLRLVERTFSQLFPDDYHTTIPVLRHRCGPGGSGAGASALGSRTARARLVVRARIKHAPPAAQCHPLPTCPRLRKLPCNSARGVVELLRRWDKELADYIQGAALLQRRRARRARRAADKARAGGGGGGGSGRVGGGDIEAGLSAGAVDGMEEDGGVSTDSDDETDEEELAEAGQHRQQQQEEEEEAAVAEDKGNPGGGGGAAAGACGAAGGTHGQPSCCSGCNGDGCCGTCGAAASCRPGCFGSNGTGGAKRRSRRACCVALWPGRRKAPKAEALERQRQALLALEAEIISTQKEVGCGRQGHGAGDPSTSGCVCFRPCWSRLLVAYVPFNDAQ
jgi:hypothetical protein